MKKVFISLMVLVIVAVALAELFVGSAAPSKPNRIFLGEWKRIDTAQKDNLIIRKEWDAIVINCGKDKTVALYNNGEKALVTYFMADTIIISYQEKTDHLLMNNGKDGEFKRVN